MKLRHLKIFKTVCEEMNMTKAAGKLFMSQPSVSQAIRELEEYYNTILFERLSQKLYITDSGRELLKYANHMLSLKDEMEGLFIEKSKLKKIKIGATVTIGTYLISPWIREFQETHEAVEIVCKIMNTKDIEENILNSNLDLAIVEGEIHSNDIVVKPLIEDDLVIVCNSLHRLSEMRNINSKQLNFEKFLIREEGSGSRELFLNEIKGLNLDINIVGEFNNNEAIKIGVKNNIGLGVVSKSSIYKYDNLSLLKVEKMKMTRNFSIAYHRNKMITEDIQFFINYMDLISKS